MCRTNIVGYPHLSIWRSSIGVDEMASPRIVFDTVSFWNSKSSCLSSMFISLGSLRCRSVLRITIFQCIPKTRFKIHTGGHFLPLIVELRSVSWGHVFVVVEISDVAFNVFFDYFPTLVIEHPLVCCFLQPLWLIFIHLLPLNNSISIANSPMCLSLIYVIAVFMVSLF